jgi:hypothetical protein
MIFPWFLVSWRAGPGQARCAGGGRAAPAPIRRVARREGRCGDSGDVLKGTHRTLNALKGTLKTSSHVLKTPLTGRTQRARPARRSQPAARPTRCAGRTGETDRKIIGGFRLNAPRARRSRSAGQATRKARSRHGRCPERRIRDAQRPERAFRDTARVPNGPFRTSGSPAEMTLSGSAENGRGCNGAADFAGQRLSRRARQC